MLSTLCGMCLLSLVINFFFVFSLSIYYTGYLQPHTLKVSSVFVVLSLINVDRGSDVTSWDMPAYLPPPPPAAEQKMSKLSELDQIIHRLEQGTILTRFYRRGSKSERRFFSIRLDTRQLLWSSLATNGRPGSIRGVINLREIKQVRIGQFAKVFDRLQLLTTGSEPNVDGGRHSNITEPNLHTSSVSRRPMEFKQCFVVLYGTNFNLKTLTCAGK